MEQPGGRLLAGRAVTRRERDVLDAVARRLRNAEIAAELGMSQRTVESHVSSLLRKLGGRRRDDLLRLARQSPAAPTLSALPRALAAARERSELTGRDAELRQLLACWSASQAATVVAVVRGEAGIGKSRLVAELAAEVHGRGGRVLFGACSDGAQRPYEPFVAALTEDVDPEPIAGGRDQRVRRSSLSRLFPQIFTHPDALELNVVDPDRERAELQACLHEILARVARSQPLLFVLEDLHWASIGTREALAHIARTVGDAPLFILVTARDERPFVDDAFSTFLGQLARLASVTTVALGGLDVVAAASVIGAVGGDLDAQEAVMQTGGNPLFLRELARAGLGSQTLRELVADRFQHLGLADLEVVDVAAVAGPQIDVALIAAVLKRTTADVLDALERIESAGVVGPGHRIGEFTFVHDVFRSVRYGGLGSSRRLRLHAEVAHVLQHHHGEQQPVAELARHACLAGLRFDPLVAAAFARQAGDAAARATDHGDAVEHYRRGLDSMALASDHDPNARLRLMTGLGGSLVMIGDPEGQRILISVVRQARDRDEPILLAAAVCAIATVPGGSHSVGDLDEEFAAMIQWALDVLPPDQQAWRARLLATLGAHLLLNSDIAAGTEMIGDAVRAARELGDPIALGQALMSFRFTLGPLEMESKLSCGRELIELGDRSGQQVFSCVGRQQLWWAYRELGDRPRMEQWEQAAAVFVRGVDFEQLSQAACVAILDGDLERATELTDRFEEIASPVGAGTPYIWPLRLAVADARARPVDIRRLELLLRSRHIYADLFEAQLARALARTGQRDRATVFVQQAYRRDFAPHYVQNLWTMAMSGFAEAAAICDEPDVADRIEQLLEPLRGYLVDNGNTIWDTIDRVRALARLAAGDAAGAAEIATRAVGASRERRSPILLARELVVSAAAAERLGGSGADAVGEARSIARRTGARIIDRDVQLFIGTPATVDPFDLTSREREIVERLGTGETNTQIAMALAIAPATVRKHLENAFNKLGVSTRTGAVARLSRAGWSPPTA